MMFFSNTAVELAPHDNEIARSIWNAMQKMENAFIDCLNKAVEVGELPKEVNTRSLWHPISPHALMDYS